MDVKRKIKLTTVGRVFLRLVFMSRLGRSKESKLTITNCWTIGFRQSN